MIVPLNSPSGMEIFTGVPRSRCNSSPAPGLSAMLIPNDASRFASGSFDPYDTLSIRPPFRSSSTIDLSMSLIWSVLKRSCTSESPITSPDRSKYPTPDRYSMIFRTGKGSGTPAATGAF